MNCLHCQMPTNWQHSLCYPCYFQPSIRALYPQSCNKKPHCKHCGTASIRNAWRELCLPCWTNPDIRALYPVKDSLVIGHGCGGGRFQLDPNPTDALPGSPEKIAVLEYRAQMGYSLFHPNDAGEAPDVAISFRSNSSFMMPFSWSK